MPIKVCVAGATGWTGSLVARRILESSEFELVGAIARRDAGRDVGEALGVGKVGVVIVSSLEEALSKIPADVLIDYTHPESVKARTLRALDHGMRAIIGTSGLTAADYDEIAQRAEARGLGVIAAGNFSITAALAKHFALIAARYLPSWEIIDYAGANKIDAPSGTVQELAEALGQVAHNELALPVEGIHGPKEARGASIGGAQVHSVRLPSYVIAFEALFGLPDERLTIRHDAGVGRGAVRFRHAAGSPPRDGDHRPGARAGHPAVWSPLTEDSVTLSLQSYLDFAVETAYLAGRLTLGYFQTGIRPDMKADDTPVTAADRASEQFIRGRIEKQYPQHAIVGEEYGVTEHAGAEFRWFVDPIDGTKSFVRGVPLYAVLIGLEIAGQDRGRRGVFPGARRNGRRGDRRGLLVERPPRARVGRDAICGVEPSRAATSAALPPTGGARPGSASRRRPTFAPAGVTRTATRWSRPDASSSCSTRSWPSGTAAPSRSSCAKPAATSAIGRATRRSTPTRHSPQPGRCCRRCCR